MNRCFIIAEIGVNHNGSLHKAKELIDIALKSGASAVKFQTFKAEDLAIPSAQQAQYQAKNDPKPSQLEMLKSLELTQNETKLLKHYADSKGIMFLSSPFDVDSLHFLISIGVKVIKLGSGEITNRFLLEAVAKTKFPVILSTGMSSLGEIEEALEILKPNPVTLLHCTTSYPTPMVDVNLNNIATLRQAFGLPVGYSDHTAGYEVSVAAVAMGAKVIEKHLTYDRNAIGPDHKASLEPNTFEEMVKSIRNVELALGSSRKQCLQSERGNRDVARKSLVWSRDMKAGETVSKSDLTAKRPGNGLSPMRINDVVDLTLKTDVDKDSLLSWDQVTRGKIDG